MSNRNRKIDKKLAIKKLRKWAKDLRAYYGVPIYLVGSALVPANEDPRDWDIRLRLPAKDFTIRFGDPFKWLQEGQTGQWTGVRYKWSAECTKRTKEGWFETNLNVDFQIETPFKFAQYRRYPKMRLA